MPIEPPNLDDLTFDRTVEELKRRIPVYAPEWTDHNDSDPGIALIQLFAYLTEQIGYRLNRVPEKNHVALLELLGVRLQAALAARSRVAFLLDDPRKLKGYSLDAGALVEAARGTPAPTFETDAAIDVVPAEVAVLVTTRHPTLHDVRLRENGSREPEPNPAPRMPARDSEWLTVAWDGAKPAFAELPRDPVAVGARADHRYLWVGLRFNPTLDAGFRDVRVSLTIQLDDDEVPDLTASVPCETSRSVGESPSSVDWLGYHDADLERPAQVPGRIDDGTAHLTRSGTIRFTVPHGIARSGAAGAAPTWKDLRTSPLVPHPLDPKLRTAVDGWLRLTLPARSKDAPPRRIRMIGFNVASVTHATTVRHELLGRGDGRPGARLALANRGVLAGTLELAMQESIDRLAPLIEWTEVASLDGAGPFESVYALDRESGVIMFGDGIRGRIPPFVPGGGEIVALQYRHGGGLHGEVPAGAITKLVSSPRGVSKVVNFVPATGGRDAETLDEAKLRARKELSTRSRAVTKSDFAWIAGTTPDVRVARAEVIGLRKPLVGGAPPLMQASARCGAPLPAGFRGLDARVAPGAVTVVVVPDERGAEPTATPSFLRAVSRHIERHRLITTEVHVVPAQYCRICKVLVTVRGKPGYTRSHLQSLVEQRLRTYFHALTGGEDGKGFPFGEQLHVADLMAQVFRTEGIERVEQLSAEVTRTKSNASPREGHLVLCPSLPVQFDRVLLAPEETVSFDATSLALTTVA